MTELELSRRERKKEETKERIFKVALKLFKHNGFNDTTIDEIAEKADVAKGTFFNYFPRKEAVLSYLPELWIEEAEDKAQAIMESAGPAGQKVRDLFTEFATFYEEEPELAKWVAMEWSRCQTQDDAVCRRWDDLGVRMIEHLQSTGEIRRDVDAARIADVFGSVHQGTVMRWLSAQDAPFPLRDELRARMDLIVEGLGAARGDRT
jgi:AcrR family transcriptional regulator